MKFLKKVLYWHLWFEEEPIITSMGHFQCTKRFFIVKVATFYKITQPFFSAIFTISHNYIQSSGMKL